MKIKEMAKDVVLKPVQDVAFVSIATYALVIDPAIKETKKLIDGAAKYRANKTEEAV